MGFGKMKSVKGLKSRLTLKTKRSAKHDDKSKASFDTPDTTRTTPVTTPETTATALSTVEDAPIEPTRKFKVKDAIVETDADEVLEGILQDLNIDPMLNLKCEDDVSDYSGGSAKSIETGTESEEEEEENDIGARVDAVIAAAEEIRRKKSSSPSTEPGPNSNQTRTKPPEREKEAKNNNGVSGRKSPSTSQSPNKGSTKKKRPTVVLEEEPVAEYEDDQPETEEETEASVAEQGEHSFESLEDDATKSTLEESTFEEGTYCEDGTMEDGTLGESLDASKSYDDRDAPPTKKRSVMNKDIIIHQPGGPSALIVRAMYYTPLPTNPEEIIIKVEASTVTFRDCMLRRGIGPDKSSFPFVPGCEVVGTISNIGKLAKLEGYRIGDRVMAMNRTGGGNGYYAKFDMRDVAPIISHKIEAAEAVCLVNVYMTAYQALRMGKRSGTPLTEANVLITDGYSPIGQAAVQLAQLEGANVYVTTTETRQDEYMKTLGVKCLPYSPNKWLHKVKGKMDVVVDNTCLDSYDSSWKALNAQGTLVCTGVTSHYTWDSINNSGCVGGGCGLVDIHEFQQKWAELKAKYVMSQTKFSDLRKNFRDDPKQYSQELKYLCFLVESGTLKPKIAERVSIEEIPDAQRYLETGKANGTIVCLP